MQETLKNKLAILADAAKYDASCASSGSYRKNLGGIGNTEGMGICHSYTPDGRCVSLLKILLTNYCIFDCLYCVNRVSSDIPRARFTVDEVVNLTLDFYRRNYIEGLFLSSGISGTSDDTMEQVVRVAKNLRTIHKFGGYIHLKSVAGSSPEMLAEAAKYADRVSANLEFPTQAELDSLAPAKSQSQIQATFADMAEKIRENREEKKKRASTPNFAPGGQSTQMIVGATESTDKSILTTAADLYQKHQLRRVYYTAFSPIPLSDARLPAKPAPLVREHRLYQADWLMRYYDFKADELFTETEPNLDLEREPKMAWAIRHPEFFPVDVNKSPKEALLRIPGIGVRNVERILLTRRFKKLTLADLGRLRISIHKAKYFILAADWHRPTPDKIVEPVVKPTQLLLFESGELARTGEL